MSQIAPRPPITDLLYEEYNRWVRWVSRFHTTRLMNELPDKPTLFEDGRVEQNLDHLYEELHEIEDAYEDHDLTGVADGIIDLIYVAIGFGIRLGLPMEAIFAEVHSANMDKIHNPTAHETRAKRVTKPEGWLPPRVAEILEARK